MQWVSYALLVILAARLAATAWDTVLARRAELAAAQRAAEPAVGRVSVVSGGPEPRPDPGLAAAIERQVAASNGVTAVYVKSLGSGASASIEEDRVFPTASLFKVPILLELLRQESLGTVDMGSSVRLQQRHWADGSGVLQAQIGNSFRVGELADLMIGKSDNVAALALLDLVGTDNVNLTLQSNGFEVTRLRIGWPRRSWGGRPGENTTTAREIATLLEAIATGRILDRRASAEAIQILSQAQDVAWLPAMLPAGTRVAHKSGELPGVRHDAGVVYGPSGPFVVAVLTEDITDYARAADSIAAIARAAYDYLEAGAR